MNTARTAWVCATLLSLLASLAHSAPRTQAGTDSLYARIGGEPKMTAIVDELVDAAWIDSQLAHFFKGVTRSKLKTQLRQQFCSLSGGGCGYAGEDMREVHAGLKIGQSDFYRLVEILRDTLVHQDVALRERNELLALLAPMKRDVVERK